MEIIASLRKLLKPVKKHSKVMVPAAAVLTAMLAFVVFTDGRGVAAVFTTDKEIPIYSVDTEDKKAALTFDCAWGASDIPDILKTLNNSDIRATFFIVGEWAQKYPDMVRMISLEGHDIANHSYSHLRMGTVDSGKISSELSKCSSRLEGLTGRKVDLFRPPYGDYSNNVVKIARDMGYYTIQWNVDSLDWRPGISREEIMSRICRKIVPGSIILFHNDTAHTAKMLPDIITALRGMGYEFIPVSELIMREDYIIDYEGRQKKK